jgi:hypothetical protein
VHILEFVPLTHRLQSCSLVSSSWAAAAAASTSSISVGTEYTRRLRSDRISSLDQYTIHHGHFITSLTLATTADCELSQLPCPHLRELVVWYGRVQLSTLLSSLTRLTSLQLFACEVLGGARQLTALTALPDLQHLGLSIRGRVELDKGSSLQGDAASTAAIDAWGRSIPAPGGLFSQLTQLTQLFLYSADVGTFRHFSCLTKLQRLSMRELGAECAAGLTALQSFAQLTRLAITQADFPISMETVPAIAALTGLRSLQLSLCRMGVDPAVLGPLSQLQELDISFSELLGGPAGMSVLLAWLPKVQHLTHLAISGHQWGMQLGGLSQQAVGGRGAVLAVPPQAYSAFTASTALQHLELSFMDVPAAAWEHIFPAGRQLPSLTTFCREQDSDSLAGTLLQSQHISCIARCCCNLQSLQLPSSVQQGACMQPLLQLPNLQELVIDSGVVQSREAFAVLLHLTTLTALQLCSDAGLPSSSLQQLTALRQLRFLDVQFASWELHSQVCVQSGGTP